MAARTLLRIARTARGKCHWVPIAGLVSNFKPTLHPAVTSNYADGPTLVWSAARCASSEAIQSHHVAPSVECTADGRRLKVSWPDGVQAFFHSVWLRHSCTCPTCYKVTTNQNLVNPPDLFGHPTIHSTEVCESQDGTDSLSISWSYSNGSEHQGKIDLASLRKNSYSLATRSALQATTTLPQLSYSEVLKGEEGVWKWMRHLHENGVCLLTDVPTQLGQIKEVAEKAKLRLSSERNDACVEGGNNVLLDAFAVVEDMREKYPQHFATLARVPATFVKTPPMWDNPISFRNQTPHISVDGYSKKVTSILWCSIDEGPLFVPEEDVEAYFEAYICLAMMFAASDLKICHRLEPGEVLTLNNRRFLHSRTAFNANGGKRHLQGVYVGTEDFKSRVRVLASQFSPDYEGLL